MTAGSADESRVPGSRRFGSALAVAFAVGLFLAGGLSGASLLVLTSGGSQGSATSSGNATPDLLLTLSPIVKPASFTPTQLADGYALGDTQAPVTIDLWADFQCPYCGLFTQVVEPQIVTTYVQAHRARLVFHDLAFLGEESRWAAVAAQLAEEQNKFWPYHDYLFANQTKENGGGFSLPRLRQIASAVGLDMARYDEGMKLEAARIAFDRIDAQASAESSALGINSTPTVVVAGSVVSKPDWATVQTAIEAALKR